MQNLVFGAVFGGCSIRIENLIGFGFRLFCVRSFLKLVPNPNATQIARVPKQISKWNYASKTASKPSIPNDNDLNLMIFEFLFPDVCVQCGFRSNSDYSCRRL